MVSDISKLAALLDARKLLCPRSLQYSIKDFPYGPTDKPPASFTEMAERVQRKCPNETLEANFYTFLSELNEAQNVKPWLVFAKNKGMLIVPDRNEDITNDGEKMLSVYKGPRIAELGAGNVEHALYLVAEELKPYEYKIPLFHELGHSLDVMPGALTAPNEDNRVNYHAKGKWWRTIYETDKAVNPKGDAFQIEWDRRSYGYLPEKKGQWYRETFAEAIERHCGPKKERSVSSGRDYLYKTVLSPLIKSYINRVVNLDMELQLQDRPQVDIDTDRKKLQEIMQKPLETYLDVPAIEALKKQIIAADTEAKKKPLLAKLEKQIDAGLQNVVADACREIGMPVPKAGRRK